jgi:Leucine-rich repeat (LRR) protein
VHKKAVDGKMLPKIVKKHISADCSIYNKDHEIVYSFPFNVTIDSPCKKITKSYSKTDDNGNIEHLYIANETFVPCKVFCLKHLKSLSVYNTPFHDFNFQLPAEIELLAHSLKHLTIHNVSITRLPKQIGKLINLMRLEITNTGLASVPDDFGNLTSLEILNLSDNNLTKLPTTITNIRKLTHLKLNNNFNLRTIQTLNGHSSLTSLETNNCSIKYIPLNLPKLTTLYMSNNNLSDIINITTLGYASSNEKSFYLDNNQIKFIPNQIRLVENLAFLYLDHNQLSYLCPNFFNITVLRYLCISNNHFSGDDLKKYKDEFMAKNPKLNIC